MTLDEFFTNKDMVNYWNYADKSLPQQRKRMYFKDGESVSIQASEFHYCSPRVSETLTDSVFYYKFELGFPSFIDDRLAEYAVDWEEPTDTVYAWVPKELIEEIIEEHGGIDVEKTLAKGEENE